MLAPFLFILCLDYTPLTSAGLNSDLGFTLEKSLNSRLRAKKIIDVDYADAFALLSESIDKATKVLHRIEESAMEIGL